MKECSLCAASFGSFNDTPLFGTGKLKDGGEICVKCYNKMLDAIKADSSLSLSMKTYTIDDVHRVLRDHEAFLANKSARNEQINNINLDKFSKFLGRKELAELHKILAPNETIDDIVQGRYIGNQGILVSTNRRLAFIDSGLVYGVRVEDFPLDKITSIIYETGLLTGAINILSSGSNAIIDYVEKAAARRFAGAVRDKIALREEAKNTTTVQPSVLDQLEKLGTLRDKGIVTEAEFNEQKKKLLEKL